MRRKPALVIIAACAAAATTGGAAPASACACDQPHGVLAATGKSPDGVRWSIRAVSHGHGTVGVDFGLEPPGYSDSGYSSTFRSADAKRVRLSANSGSGLDPSGERDVSGITARRATSVVITLTDGSTVTARPVLARPAAVRRYRWLRHLRFFDVFLPKTADTTKVVARDAQGRVVGTQKL